MNVRRLWICLLCLPALAGLALAAAAQPAARGQAATPERQAAVPERQAIPDETCLGCHGQPGASMPLENGEQANIYVAPEVIASSVHGQMGFSCVQCHTNVGNYPHPPFQAADRRDMTLQLNAVCANCHQPQFTQLEDSVHAAALEAGNRNAAVCTDCHTGHAVQRLTEPGSDELTQEARQWVPRTCAQCHYAIFEVYAGSVHGVALLEENDPNVPTCSGCHGVHSIEDPGTAAFRLRSPQICAGCHTDPQIMAPYGLSTQVVETYVADFHGTTVTLFEQQHPDQEANEAVCYDCHGIHDILSTRDPEKGLQVRANLLQRCQACHPGATENFPDAWLSHYIPSPQRHPLVFSVNLFYRIFIPTLLGGMAVLVILDASSLLRGRRQARPLTVGVFPVPSQNEKGAIPSDQPAVEPGPETPAPDRPEPNGTSPDPDQESPDD